MKETTETLLKRYEPTNLDKLDILRVIYPVIKSKPELDEKVIEKVDDTIRRILFPKSYVQKESCDKIYEEWKQGDLNSFNKLVERNLHLPSLILSKIKFDSPFDNDLFEEGIILVILYLKKYNITYSTILSSYLNHSLIRPLTSMVKERYIKEDKEIYINSINSNPVLLTHKDDYYYECVNDFIEKDNFNLIKDILFKTSHLSFLEKTVLMATLGLINDFPIKSVELAQYFGCVPQNINQALKNALSKVEKLKCMQTSPEIYNYNIKFKYSIFKYFCSDKKIVLNCMDDLDQEEIELIKYVWGNDFSSMKNLSDINFTSEQVVIYYKAIAKIYKNIKMAAIHFNTVKEKKKNNKDNDKETLNTVININRNMSFYQIKLKTDIYLKNNVNINSIFLKISQNNNVVDYLFFMVDYDIDKISIATNLSIHEVESILKENKSIKQTIIDTINNISGFTTSVDEEKGQAYIKK